MQDFADDVPDLEFDGICLIVEGQHGRDDGAACLRCLLEVSQMDAGEGHFPWGEDEGPALLEVNVRRSPDQRRRRPVPPAGTADAGGGVLEGQMGRK